MSRPPSWLIELGRTISVSAMVYAMILAMDGGHPVLSVLYVMGAAYLISYWWKEW